MSKLEDPAADAAEFDHPSDVSNFNGEQDVFGQEKNHDIKYKTLTWQAVAMLMITEIVSNGILSLPSSLAAIGWVPGTILIVFLGVFATYTSVILIRFKLRHPSVHNMSDAGAILFGPIGRELLGFGTCVFAILAAGGQMLAGQIALSAISDNAVCALTFTGIFCAAIFLFSLPRTFDNIAWISILSVIGITVAGIVGMIGAGAYPQADRVVVATEKATFYTAFISITNPVYAYAGHFMFFSLMSEMKNPRDAIKSAYTLQSFATSFYTVFAVVTYVYIGSKVDSPSFSSLKPVWAKAAYGIAIPNLWIGGALYAHTAAKIVFVRIFRHSRHLHDHTVLGWSVWVGLVAIVNVVAFVLAVGVPIFNFIIGITASLFAAWFTYGLAGFFWLHDSYHDDGGFAAWRRKPYITALMFAIILAGGFICVAGMYVTIVAIVDAYADGLISTPFTCG